MTELEPCADPARLYAALGGDVNPQRPLFTGDVFSDVDIPGVGRRAALLIGHPCSIRGRHGTLTAQTPVAAVEAHETIPADRWVTGYFSRMPLPGLPLEGEFHVARLDLIGLALTADLQQAKRVACLSHPGINQLQQRLVHHQTRLMVPARLFQVAFDHTYEEADLLEVWTTELHEVDENPAAGFDAWIRSGDPSRQSRLRQPQERAAVRRELRNEIRHRLR